ASWIWESHWLKPICECTAISSEYPILQAMRHGDHRTDIDILAVRVPHACQLVPQQGRSEDADVDLETPDPSLGLDAGFLAKARRVLEILRTELPECCRRHVIPSPDIRNPLRSLPSTGSNPVRCEPP